MIKGVTALTLFINFVEREGRIPTVHEFVDWGYARPHYYKVRKSYYEMIKKEADAK